MPNRNSSAVKKLLFKAFAEGRGDDDRLHAALVRLGIETDDHCREFLHEIAGHDDIWPAILRGFNRAKVAQPPQRRLRFWRRTEVRYHQRAGVYDDAQMRDAVIKLIAHVFGLDEDEQVKRLLEPRRNGSRSRVS